METIFLPSKISITEGDNVNEAVVSIHPCQPGYGITLGNALRRVLLSSLPGGAVTTFKIKGADHEFATLPHVKEDAVDITLNLKQIRVKVYGDEPVKLNLKVKGDKVITAGDFEVNSEAEIVNPKQVIATLTNKDAEFEMEITASKGRGYVPVEVMNKENLAVGEIAIDAIFTPVRNVAFTVENVRVGDQTNFEQVDLKVETDGAITPKQAVEQATAILLDHFNLIAEKVTSGEVIPQMTQEKMEEMAAPIIDLEAEAEVAETSEEEKPRLPETEAAGDDGQAKKRGRPKKEDSEDDKEEK